ncbi:MAG TPA: hypothetical protein DCL60_14020, partial [Armatimonadetes bacterium]|nr:hypothetical protein [Armatimonadota bacterium]
AGVAGLAPPGMPGPPPASGTPAGDGPPAPAAGISAGGVLAVFVELVALNRSNRKTTATNITAVPATTTGKFFLS